MSPAFDFWAFPSIIQVWKATLGKHDKKETQETLRSRRTIGLASKCKENKYHCKHDSS